MSSSTAWRRFDGIVQTLFDLAALNGFPHPSAWTQMLDACRYHVRCLADDAEATLLADLRKVISLTSDDVAKRLGMLTVVVLQPVGGGGLEEERCEQIYNMLTSSYPAPTSKSVAHALAWLEELIPKSSLD